MSLRKHRVVLLRLAMGPIVLLAVFAPPEEQAWSVAPFAIELAGYILLLAGVMVRIWSILYIGGRKSHQLVTEGPYSICRNPLYVGTFLLATGASLCFVNPLMLAATLLVLVPAHLAAAGMEERNLLERFPQEYAAYAKDVPRFWPRISHYRSSPAIEVPVRAIRRITIDTLGWLLLPELEDLLEILHEHGIVPVLIHWP